MSQGKLQTYLTVGAGCLMASQAQAVITIVPVNATSYDGFGTGDREFSFMLNGDIGGGIRAKSLYWDDTDAAPVYGSPTDSFGPSRTNSYVLSLFRGSFYHDGVNLLYGATDGTDNFLLTTSGAVGNPFDIIVQFSFSETPSSTIDGSIIALAFEDDGGAIDFADAVAQLQAIPEPSHLALLAMGSAGLLARRRRKACSE